MRIYPYMPWQSRRITLPITFTAFFRQQVGEAPKQYVLRLRLEKGRKELLFYPVKTIYAIALDCGFTSQSGFARAFKEKYGLTAEQYRRQALQAIRERAEGITVDVQQYPISVARTEKLTLACEMTRMDDGAIMQTFHQLHQWAAAHGCLSGVPEYYGVFLDTPHTTAPAQCRYLAGIRIQGSFSGRECYTIKGMTIARIPVMGGFDVIMDYALFVKQRWMLDSGYSLVQGVPGYEHFSAIDFNIPYQQHYRTICVGIQPK